MNRIVASKHFLRPLHDTMIRASVFVLFESSILSRALSAMTQTDSSIVWVNFVAREPMFQYNERVSRKQYVDMVRRRSSLRFLDRKRSDSEIAQCMLPVKTRFAPKTQPPSKWTWAWHQTLVRPLFLPSSNLWMGFFSRRGYVTCLERLTVPEFRVSEDLIREEEYLLRHPWTGSRMRVPKGITSEMLSEPERVVVKDGEPRLLPTIRAAKSNLKTAKQRLLFEQRSEGKTLPYSTNNLPYSSNNLKYKSPPEEAKEAQHPAAQTQRRGLSAERECLRKHLGDLLPAPVQRPAVRPLHYHRDGPTRTLLNRGMIHNIRAKVPELTPRPTFDLMRCQTYTVDTRASRIKVPFTVEEFRKHQDTKDITMWYENQLMRASSESMIRDRRANNSSRKPKDTEESQVPKPRAKSNNALQRPKRPEAPRAKPNNALQRPKRPEAPAVQRPKRIPKAPPAVQPKKERGLRVPIAVMEFVRTQELLADRKARYDETKARWNAARQKPPAEPVEIPKQEKPKTGRKMRLHVEPRKEREPARVPFVMRDFIEENKHFPRTKTWYFRRLRPSSESLCFPDSYYMRNLRQSYESKAPQATTKAPTVRRAVPPPPPPLAPQPPRTSVSPPKRRVQAKTLERRWRY